MPLRSTDAGWGALVRAFHWLIALLIIVQGVIGLAMVEMGLTPAKVRLFALHKSIGLTLLALVLLRITWRLTERGPPIRRRCRAGSAAQAHAMHVALYLLILALPLSGWWFNSAANAPLVWFWLVDVPSLTHGYAPAWKPRALLAARSPVLAAGRVAGDARRCGAVASLQAAR